MNHHTCQELHRRRLQVKSKSKFHKKSKGTFLSIYNHGFYFSYWGYMGHLSKILVGMAYGTSKSHGKDLDSKDHVDRVSSTTIEYSSVPNLQSNGNNNSSLHQDNVAADSATKKRQKLFWGYDLYLSSCWLFISGHGLYLSS